MRVDCAAECVKERLDEQEETMQVERMSAPLGAMINGVIAPMLIGSEKKFLLKPTANHSRFEVKEMLRTDIYAKAYTRDAEFYRLYRSLNAYQNTIGGDGDLLVIKPDSEFFRYFNDPTGNNN